MDEKAIWETIREELEREASREPALRAFFERAILSHDTLGVALSSLIAGRLGSLEVTTSALFELLREVSRRDEGIALAAARDLEAIFQRDPACSEYSMPLLYYKGFHAIETHRFTHSLWKDGRRSMARYLQNRSSEVFGVDIHPAAVVGSGILLDHATGLVIGETAIVGDNVSILHEVTLGGTGKTSGDRHPKVGPGVMIGAGAKILGNVRIGENSKIGAGSVVLQDVAPHCTVVGVPARTVGRCSSAHPAEEMDQAKDIIDEQRSTSR